MKIDLQSKIFLLVLTFFSYTVEAKGQNSVGDGNWVKDSIRKGFTLYTRSEPNSKILGIKIEGKIKAPVDQVMAQLRDVENSTDWTPGLLIKSTIEDVDDKTAYTYSLSNMPWPLYDRDMILHNELLLDKKRKLLFILSKSVEHPKAIDIPDRVVRAHLGYSNLGMRPLDKENTYVELTVFIDPRGSIPSWLINFYQKKWPLSFLKSLEKHCHENPIPLRPGLRTMLHNLLEILEMPKNMFDS
jgi:hypothetical protein